jgi:hypothetical protein
MQYRVPVERRIFLLSLVEPREETIEHPGTLGHAEEQVVVPITLNRRAKVIERR